MEVASDPAIREPAALARWLDTQDVPGAGLPLGFEFVSGGASNEIFALQRGPHRVALRRPPRRIPPGRNETMLREYRVLAALRDSDVPHPRVFAACDDPEVMDGACFYVMEFVDGWSPMSGGPRWPEPFDGDPEARPGLAFQLVDGIARLARVDWRAVGLEGFGRPEGFLERQVDRWLAHLAGFKMACVLEGGYARHVRGEGDNQKLAAFGDVVLDMARRAAELARASTL